MIHGLKILLCAIQDLCIEFLLEFVILVYVSHNLQVRFGSTRYKMSIDFLQRLLKGVNVYGCRSGKVR